ncbi:DUF3466 family protein [Streptomyces lunaelactis]|uniref:DUF3466 family protein n=1 Tax=Streptomyces lunaelactis TaxID=1535768 RepID=UPI001584D9D0|nr:DUF3466 family protein [Streptomyces lunaelactis]NUL02541.1 DUF3466 family protein [Streptomyces lunaelactis]
MTTVTSLVAAPVTGNSDANGLNGAGVVVGTEDDMFPFLWTPQQPNGATGSATRLPVLFTGSAPGSGEAMSVNANGDACGMSEGLDANGNSVQRAVRWSGGVVQDLGTLIPDPFNPGNFLGNSRAVDINDAGQVVGSSDTAGGSTHAFLFDPALGIMRDLGSLIVGPPDQSRATSINNNGDIVGVSAALDPSGGQVERAFLLPAGSQSMTDLGTLIPDPANPGGFLGNSNAFGINDSATIIGTSETTGTTPSGAPLTGVTRFFSAGSPVPLLPVHSDGFDVGPNNEVVGGFDMPTRGFSFHSSTGMVDLTTLASTSGMQITFGNSVNASGQITASAEVSGSSVGVLITP